MREIIRNQLWIGNARDGESVSCMMANEIAAVVHLALEEPPCQFPRDMIYCRIPLLDGTGNSAATLQLAIKTVTDLIKLNIPTLVTCSGGMSRSPAVVAVASASAMQESPDKWLKKIAALGPHDISPALWNELKRCGASK